MMNFINTATLEYPLTELQVRAAFPSVSFPGEGFAPRAPFAVVHEVEQPAFNPLTHTLAEGLPEFVGGQWRQTWVLTARDFADFQAHLQTDIIERTQQRLDEFAQTRGYDDIKSAAGYAGCSVAKFAAEGVYCRDARAETWAALYQLFDDVTAGNWPTAGAGQVPTSFEDIEAGLPALEWPL